MKNSKTRHSLMLVCCVGTILYASLSARAGSGLILPFSTTYNCAEQNQQSPGWVSCDGIGAWGGWTTGNGSKEQITAAANYPGGGGGGGQRHWMGQSSGNTNGSGGVMFSPASMQQELYIRWYTRWQAGLKLGGNAPPVLRAEKLVYFTGGNCGQPYGCVFDIEGAAYSFGVAGHPYYCGNGWDALFGGSNAASDGRWVEMELHLKNATNNLNNGVVQVWVDGNQVCNLTNIDFAGSTGFQAFAFPENGQFTVVNGADMYQDFDDVAIRTTGPIGPIGGSTSSLIPAAPYNLHVIR